MFQLLNERERKRSAFLLLSIFLNSIVEILGLAIIVPVIGLVIKPETIQQEKYLRRAFQIGMDIGIDTPNRFLMVLCALMVFAFLFKAVFGLAVNLFQTRFAFSVAHRLSGDVWTFHFSQSLVAMRSYQTGQLLSEINAWPIQFAQTFMVGGLMIMSEITVISVIALGLLAYNPFVFLSIGLMLVLGAVVIRKATHRRMGSYSDIRMKLEPRTNTLITNSIRGFLEVITFRASDAVRDLYLKDRWTIFRIQSITTVLNLAPAKLYEVLAVLAIASSISIALIQDTPQSGFLQLLTFMAVSAYRVMPSMSRINGAIMQMRSHTHVLDVMESAVLSTIVQSDVSNISKFENPDGINIHLQDVTLEYDALKVPVLRGLTTSFVGGQIHGIVGSSGSGKSTLLNAILGLHKPTNGTIELNSKDEESLTLGTDLSLHNWMLNVGYLSQQPFLFKGSIRENLTLRVPGTIINEDRVKALVDKLELNECLGSNPLEFQLQEGGGNLSGGQQQRLALLRALQIDRPVLILDEATSAVDIRLRNVVYDLLQQRASEGCNIILVTHDSELADRCDSVLNLETLHPLSHQE